MLEEEKGGVFHPVRFLFNLMRGWEGDKREAGQKTEAISERLYQIFQYTEKMEAQRVLITKLIKINERKNERP